MINFLKEYLQNHSLEDLKNEYGIKSSEYEDLVIFSYSQIDSPKTDPIVRMSRGIVLEKDTWEIVAYPFYRFFNFEEVLEERNKFNWDKVVSTEKIDGSLMQTFYYKNKWYVSTRSMIGGENRITTNLYSFKDLFNMAITPFSEEEFYNEISKDWIPGTISFTWELVSPFHQIVTPYKENKLYLIGARYLGEDTNNLKKYQELKFEDVYNSFSDKLKSVVKCPKIISLIDENGKFRGFEEMKKLSESGNATDEGFVVVDYSTIDNNSMSFPRTKVKNSAYVALHHLRSSIEGEDDGISYHKILNILFKHEEDEFLAVLPQYKDIFEKVNFKWINFVNYMNNVMTNPIFKQMMEMAKDSNKKKEFQKEFALFVKNLDFSDIYFAMYNKGFKDWYEVIENQINIKSADTIFKRLWLKIKDWNI